MAIISRGYEPNESAAKNTDREFQLFSQNIDLILKHEQNILACRDYFFCSLPFAYSSWLYCSGDGQLFLGYLLLAWKTGQLTEQCPTCMGRVIVSSFSGSPLTGRNSWSGLCLGCRQRQIGKESKNFLRRMEFIIELRKKFPAAVEQVEEYDGQEFTWGGNELKPVRKKKTIWKPVAEPVDLATLVKELNGHIRKGRPVNVHHLLKKKLELKLSKSLKKDSVYFRL